MPTVHNTNKACCDIPPVQSDYRPKGIFKALGDFKKVYVTGPEKSGNAIVCVYDIFGYFPQTQQGADIVAQSLGTTVYMPDFFEPEGPFDIGRYPPKNDTDSAAIQAFFGGIANPPSNVQKLTKFGQYLNVWCRGRRPNTYDNMVDVISKKPFAGLNDAKFYRNMFHGWAAARGNLKNDDNRREYDDAYKRLVTFFVKTL